jgi:hypothetical protein
MGGKISLCEASYCYFVNNLLWKGGTGEEKDAELARY